MKEIPEWVEKAVKQENLKCIKCQTSIGKEQVSAIGVKDSLHKPNNEYLFIEFSCISCGQVALYELQPMDMLSFAFMIIDDRATKEERQEKEEAGQPDENYLADDEINQMEEDIYKEIQRNKKGKYKPHKRKYKKFDKNANKANDKKNSKSKITIKDIKQASNFLNSSKCPTHEDFLIQLGMTPEEIRDYDYKKKE